MNKLEPKGVLSYLTYLSDRGGVGYIRTIFPDIIMGAWRYKQMSIDPIHLSNFITDPYFYKNIAFIKIQRSATNDQLIMLKHLKRTIKKPIIYEIDDLLFDIPETNFASKFYKENEENIKEILSLVDGITVSTKPLQNIYSEFNNNISVIPNRLPKCLWGDFQKFKDNQNKKLKILYAGSQNHFALQEKGGDFGSEFLEFIKKTQEKYEWIFFGGIPYELKNNKNIIYYPWIDFISYPSFLKLLNIDIAMAPLENNKFNKCKSNLKFLEYTLCGFPGIYSNIYPYFSAFCKVDSDQGFISEIERMEKNIDYRKEILEKDQNTLKDIIFFEDHRKKYLNNHLKLFNYKIE